MVIDVTSPPTQNDSLIAEDAAHNFSTDSGLRRVLEDLACGALTWDSATARDLLRYGQSRFAKLARRFRADPAEVPGVLFETWRALSPGAIQARSNLWSWTAKTVTNRFSRAAAADAHATSTVAVRRGSYRAAHRPVLVPFDAVESELCWEPDYAHEGATSCARSLESHPFLVFLSQLFSVCGMSAVQGDLAVDEIVRQLETSVTREAAFDALLRRKDTLTSFGLQPSQWRDLVAALVGLGQRAPEDNTVLPGSRRRLFKLVAARIDISRTHATAA